jgi:hypothetical protein
MGMLIGVLGGPVGVLVGWGAGALMGGLSDIARVDRSDEALVALGRAIFRLRPHAAREMLAPIERRTVSSHRPLTGRLAVTSNAVARTEEGSSGSAH